MNTNPGRSLGRMGRAGRRVSGALLLLLAGMCSYGQRQMEVLGRGVVATPGTNAVFVSWRLLAGDPEAVSFNVYRTSEGEIRRKLNDTPITISTCFSDASVGDLDGDGEYEIRPGRGAAFDIDPRHAAHECWVAGAGITGLFNARGEQISAVGPGTCNMGIWWDGDLLRELLNGVTITKWDYQNSRELPVFTGADFDVWQTTAPRPTHRSARIFLATREKRLSPVRATTTTTIPTEHRITTLMHDPVYRLGIAWQNVAYNQPAHTGYFLGMGSNPPAKPANKSDQNGDHMRAQRLRSYRAPPHRLLLSALTSEAISPSFSRTHPGSPLSPGPNR